MKKTILLLAAVSVLCGCNAMRKASETGRKVGETIAHNYTVVFDTVDGAIGVAEGLKTDVTGVFKKGTNATETATK